jgi:glycosyltransferase involved in cell wall biosynthesis
MIFEAIGPYNAIGKVAVNSIRVALDAGYKVTVVAKRLDESLRREVEWLPLYVPPRLFYVQWITAGWFMRKTIGNRKFDIVHSHQPQAAYISDVFQCHFLTRMAYERDCFDPATNLRGRFMRAQELGVLRAEDRCYSNWNPRTRMLYDSELTRQDFTRIYGTLPHENVLVYAFPNLDLPTEEERRSARTALVGLDHKGPVVGFLGGTHERKGYRRLIQGLEGDNDAFLLMGGAHCDGYDPPSLRGRFRSVGLVGNTAQFYAACDAFVVPSLYEPLGLVAFEAAARGVPVIATGEVGALPHLMEYGMGFRWLPGEPLAPLVADLAALRSTLYCNARNMAHALGEAQYGVSLLKVYREILDSKGMD